MTIFEISIASTIFLVDVLFLVGELKLLQHYPIGYIATSLLGNVLSGVIHLAHNLSM